MANAYMGYTNGYTPHGLPAPSVEDTAADIISMHYGGLGNEGQITNYGSTSMGYHIPFYQPVSRHAHSDAVNSPSANIPRPSIPQHYLPGPTSYHDMTADDSNLAPNFADNHDIKADALHNHLSDSLEQGSSAYSANEPDAVQQKIYSLNYSEFWDSYDFVTAGFGENAVVANGTHRQLFDKYPELQNHISCKFAKWLAERLQVRGSREQTTTTEVTAASELMDAGEAANKAMSHVTTKTPSQILETLQQPTQATPDAQMDSTTDQAADPGRTSNSTSSTQAPFNPTGVTSCDYPDGKYCVKIEVPNDDWLAEEAKLQHNAQQFYDVLLAQYEQSPSGFNAEQMAKYVLAQDAALKVIQKSLSTELGRADAMRYCHKLASCIVCANKHGVPVNMYANWKEMGDRASNRKHRFAKLTCSARRDAVIAAISANKLIGKDVTNGDRLERMARDPEYELENKLLYCKNNKRRADMNQESKGRVRRQASIAGFDSDVTAKPRKQRKLKGQPDSAQPFEPFTTMFTTSLDMTAATDVADMLGDYRGFNGFAPPPVTTTPALPTNQTATYDDLAGLNTLDMFSTSTSARQHMSTQRNHGHHFQPPPNLGGYEYGSNGDYYAQTRRF